VAKRAKASKQTVKRSSARLASRSPKKATKKATKKNTKKIVRRKSAARATATRTRARKAKRKVTSTRRPSGLQKATALVVGAATNAALAIAQRLPWAADENDPIVLLETDHRRFEALLKAGEDTTARAVKTRKQLLERLADELSIHELIEEKVLYPALEPHATARDIVLEGYEEHHVADVVLSELKALAPSNETWGAKFKVLKESLEHHIQEEEGQMFRLARAVLSRDEQLELGAKMKSLRSENEG
jgi:hypothetical protein